MGVFKTKIRSSAAFGKIIILMVYIPILVLVGIEGKIEFEKIMVVPSTTSDNFTSVKLIDEIPDGMSIVTKGAYFVYAQSKAGMLKYEH